MKPRTSFLKRGLSLLLAMVMILSNANLGVVLQANAAEVSVKASQVIADNYNLTDAEKTLLTSGYLAGDSDIEYNVPGAEDNLLSVDAESKKIIAKNFEGWTAVSADVILSDGNVHETIAITNGEGTYTYDGNTFTAKVTYALKQDVDHAPLTNLSYIVQDVANADLVAAQDANLGLIEEGLPAMYSMITGATDWFDAAAQTGIQELKNQYDANGGKLNLSVMIASYNQGKTAYLKANAPSMYKEAAAVAVTMSSMYSGMTNVMPLLPNLAKLWGLSAADVTLIQVAYNTLNTLATSLPAATASQWNIVSNPGIINSGDATLDGYIKDVGTPTPVSVKNPLTVATTDITSNMAMFNVAVTVNLMVVTSEADKTDLVEGGTHSATVAVVEDATAEQIAAAVQPVIDAAIASFGAAYVDGQFTATATALPEKLTEDITYTVTYNPNTYTVSTDWSEALTVPYGYQMTLPKHDQEMMSYDYTVNGAPYSQGSVYTVVGNTNATRKEGKAYTNTDLYTIVADNYGANDLAKAILKSGALKGNEKINVRKPDPKDADILLVLKDGKLTAKDGYPASYKNLNWTPYTYGGANGDENAFGSNLTVKWSDTEVNARYVLNLTNFTVAQVTEILNTAKTVKAEADEQVKTLDALAANYSIMGQLDKTKLGALNGVIDVTDFTPGDGPVENGTATDDLTDAKNQELQAYFKNVVGGIISNNLDGNNKLKIYNMLGNYNAEGLLYYYKNSADVIAEIDSLSGYLSDMLADAEKEAALGIMVSAAGFPQYAGEIAKLEQNMAAVKAALTAPNAAIDLNSTHLTALVNLLSGEGTVETKTAGVPYLVSEKLNVADSTEGVPQTYKVVVTVKAGGASESYTLNIQEQEVEVDGNKELIATLTQTQIDDLLAQVEAFAAKNVKDVNFYTSAITDGAELVAGTLNTNLFCEYTYTAKTWAIKLGETTLGTVSIENPTIDLPGNPNDGCVYNYVIGGSEPVAVRKDKGVYTLTDAQLATLNAGGTITVTRTEVNEADEALDDMLEIFVQGAPAGSKYVITNKAGDPVIYMENGKLVNKSVAGDLGEMRLDISANKDGLMNFAMGLFNSGYSNIALNGQSMLYMNDEDTLEISLQVLINAILADTNFNRDLVIQVGETGKGTLLTTPITFGDGTNSRTLGLVMNVNGMPAMMATVANGLDTIKPYMNFYSTGDSLMIELDLPEKVYEAYLTAAIASGEIDKNNITAINNEIAYRFFWDYINEIVNTDADADSFENTINKAFAAVGSNKTMDLSRYNDYYTLVKKALTNPGVTVNSVPGDGNFDIKMDAKGKSAIDAVLNTFGIDASTLMVGNTNALSMVKEYKDGNICATVEVTLADAGTNFQALVIEPNNIKEAGMKNKLNAFDYTSDLPARVAQMNNGTISVLPEAIVVLLDDVDGNLNFPGETFLDLNGHTVNGNVTTKSGLLMIFDSRLETNTNGTVTGNVKGGSNTIVLGGCYPNCDVTPYLKPGYTDEDGYVRNALYTIENDGTNVTFVLDSGIVAEKIGNYTTFGTALASDLACDLLLNYFTAAALNYGTDNIYAVNFSSLMTLLSSTTKVDDVITTLVDGIGATGISNLTNDILEDMLTFGDLRTALNGDGIVGTYAMSTDPWAVDVSYVSEGDYIDFAIVSNPNLRKDFNVIVKIGGENLDPLKAIVSELADTTTASAMVQLAEPGYNGAENTVNVAGHATVTSTSDLTKRPYDTVLAVIIAHGDSAQKDAIVKALNNYDDEALKKAIDQVTVKELFDGMKALNRDHKFAEIATGLGVSRNDLTDAAELEAIFHQVICGLGKALEMMQITGMDAKLGGLYDADSGYYVLERNPKPNGTVGAGNYFLNYNIDSIDVKIAVKLFGDKASYTLPENLEINGVPVGPDSEILDTEHDKYGDYILATSYTYANPDSNDVHTQYPTSMQVWELFWDYEAEEYKPVEVADLKDILTYKGTSIRVSDKGDGIRFFTELLKEKRSALIDGTMMDRSETLAGYKLVEAGTLFGWADEREYLNHDTVKSTAAISYVYGGEAGTNFRVFKELGDENWYTGVIGPNVQYSEAKTLARDFIARPFITLERTVGDTTETITIYGGAYERSIFYVATQNTDVFADGSAWDKYIDEIISKVENYQKNP